MQGCKEAGIPCFGTLWDFVSIRALLWLQALKMTEHFSQ